MGQHSRAGGQGKQEERRACAEDGPVERHAGIGLEPVQLPQRGKRRSGYRHRHRQHRSDGDCADDADGSVHGDRERAGTHRAENAAGITAAENFAADRLQGHDERSERSDQAEHAGGDGLGPDRPLALAFDDRCDPEDSLGSRRKQLDEVPQHRCDIAVAAGQPQASPEVGGTAAKFLPGERRSGQYPVDPVDVILDDLVGEHANAGNREPDTVHWLPGHGIEARVAYLLSRVEVVGKRLADAKAEAACGLLADDNLAWPPKAGTPATGDDDTVLAEVEAVDRADEFHPLVEGRPRIGEAGSQGTQAVEGHIRFGRPHPRQTRDLVDPAGAVRPGANVEVGRVTGREDPREG